MKLVCFFLAIEQFSETVICHSCVEAQDPPKHSGHLVVWLDKHIGQPPNNVELKNKFEKHLQSLTSKSESIEDEENISYMSPYVLYELKDEAYALNLFSHEDTCLKFITLNANKDIFFITSGVSGKSIMPKIARLKQIYATYIFCGSISYHTSWVLNYIEFITAIFDNEEDLLLRLMKDISSYLQERDNSDWYKIKENENYLRKLRGDSLSIPVEELSLNRFLLPADYHTVMTGKFQAEKTLAL
jgi:hypothetical protein